MALRTIPTLLKHVTAAIFSGNSISGSGDEKFLHAFLIARGTLVRQGHLAGGSEDGPIDNIKLTSKGLRQSRKHLLEVSGHSKTMLFDKMYIRVQTLLEGPPNAQNPESTKKQTPDEAREVRKATDGAKKKYVTS